MENKERNSEQIEEVRDDNLLDDEELMREVKGDSELDDEEENEDSAFFLHNINLESEERFSDKIQNKKRKQKEKSIIDNEKRSEKEYNKSIKRDRRLAKWIKFKNNLKLTPSTALYSILSSLSEYLDYAFNVITIVAIGVGIYFSIYYIYNQNWIMSLTSIAVALVATFISERINK